MIMFAYLPLVSQGSPSDMLPVIGICILVATAIAAVLGYALGFVIGKKAGLRAIQRLEGRGFPVVTDDPSSTRRSDDSVAP
jgi:membrane protein DedA with SNARE-associated domain